VGNLQASAGLLALDVRPDGKEFAVAGSSENVDIVDVGTLVLKRSLGMSGLRMASEMELPPPGHTNRIFSVLYVASCRCGLTQNTLSLLLVIRIGADVRETRSVICW
jgi:hypothetical protein